MECKKIQEWLMTDHLDGELSPAESAKVRQHMDGCMACREFGEVVNGTVAAPFKGFAELQPDPIVWEKVRGMIAAEEDRSGGWLKKFERILQPTPLFRAAFAAAMVLMVVLLAKWPFNAVEPAYAYMEEQMTFMETLQTGNPDLLNGDLDVYGSALEDIVK